MNEVAFPVFGLLVTAIAVGLVTFFAFGLAKYNAAAGEQKRSQGWKIAAGAVAVLLVGFCFFFLASISHDVQHVVPIPEYGRTGGPATAVPAPLDRARPTAGVWQSSSASINAGGAEMHVESGGTHHVHFHQADAHGVVQSKLAWGPIALLTLVVGGIILVAASRRGTSAILAGLGIVVALLFLYALRSSATLTARTPPTLVPPVAVDSVNTPAPVSRAESAQDSPTRPLSPAAAVPAATAEKSSAEGKAETDQPEAKTEPDAEHSAAQSTIAEKEPKPPAPRPAWVGSQPTMVGGVYQATVVSGPYASEWECEERLSAPLQEAVQRYANRLPNVRYFAGLSTDYIRREIVADTYFEPVQASFGPMLKLHALLKIDQNDVARLEQITREWEAKKAVQIASTSAACVLGALVAVYGGLVYAGRKKTPTPDASATAAEVNV